MAVCATSSWSNSNGGASLDTGRIVNRARDCLIARGHQGESVRKGVRARISPSEETVGGKKRGWIRAGESRNWTRHNLQLQEFLEITVLVPFSTVTAVLTKMILGYSFLSSYCHYWVGTTSQK